MSWSPMKSYRGYQGVGGNNKRPMSVQELLSGQAIQPEPMGETMPDLAGAQGGARSSRRIADMLTDRAMSRNATGLVDGFSQLGEAFLANKAGKRADAADQQYSQMVQALTQKATQGDEASIAALLSPEAAISRRDQQQRYGVDDGFRQAGLDLQGRGVDLQERGLDHNITHSNRVFDREGDWRGEDVDFRNQGQAFAEEMGRGQLGLGWANHALNKNAIEAKSQAGPATIAPSPEAGMQSDWDDEAGEWVSRPVRGGKVERELQAEDRQRRIRFEGQRRAGETALRDINRGLERLDEMSKDEGTLGAGQRAISAILPGTNASRFNEDVKSFLSNLGIEKIMEIRASGATLGAIPFQQQERLEQLQGNFSLTMSPTDLRENLIDINNAFVEMAFGTPAERQDLIARGILTEEEEMEIRQRYKSKGSVQNSVPGLPVGHVADGFEYVGGDPNDERSWRPLDDGGAPYLLRRP
jgi:hypothetical protein